LLRFQYVTRIQQSIRWISSAKVLLNVWRFEIIAKPTFLCANRSGRSLALSEHPTNDGRCRCPLAVPDPISSRRHATSSCRPQAPIVRQVSCCFPGWNSCSTDCFGVLDPRAVLPIILLRFELLQEAEARRSGRVPGSPVLGHAETFLAALRHLITKRKHCSSFLAFRRASEMLYDYAFDCTSNHATGGAPYKGSVYASFHLIEQPMDGF
jgi:hypothetical protein